MQTEIWRDRPRDSETGTSRGLQTETQRLGKVQERHTDRSVGSETGTEIQTPKQGQAGRHRYSDRAFHRGQWRRRGLQRCVQGCGFGVSKGRGPAQGLEGRVDYVGVAWMRRVPTTPDCCGRGGGGSPGKRRRWGEERRCRNEPISIRFLRPGLGSETDGEGTPTQIRSVAI